MGVLIQPDQAPSQAEAKRRLVAVEAAQHRAELHLFTYAIGNALFWLLWAAISVSADAWYWWVLFPLAGWTCVLTAHLAHVRTTPPTTPPAHRLNRPTHAQRH